LEVCQWMIVLYLMSIDRARALRRGDKDTTKNHVTQTLVTFEGLSPSSNGHCSSHSSSFGSAPVFFFRHPHLAS
jgi:hypothetical protein